MTTIKANKSTQRHPLFRTSIARSKSLPVVTAFSARCHRAAVRSGLELCRRRNAIVHNPRRAAGRLDTPSTWCGQVTGIRRAAFKGFVGVPWSPSALSSPTTATDRQRDGPELDATTSIEADHTPPPDRLGHRSSGFLALRQAVQCAASLGRRRQAPRKSCPGVGYTLLKYIKTHRARTLV